MKLGINSYPLFLDLFDGAIDDPHTVGEQAGIGGVVNVGLHHGGVAPELASHDELFLPGLVHQRLIRKRKIVPTL
jgi:hypothetical protein